MRKKNWLLTMLMLVATIATPSMTWAQEMYTVFDTVTGTLTFKYDNDKPESTDDRKVYDFPTTSTSIYTTPDWITNHNSAITTVVFDASFADARPTSCYKWFYDCNALVDIQNIKNLNTSNVKYLYSTFLGCSSLESLDLSNFNTANVEKMTSMFYGCSSLKSLTLSSKFNTANVTNMSSMFSGCKGLTSLELSNFNTTNVTDMLSMFNGCSGLESLDLSNFNTANVTDMRSMFCSCTSLKSLTLSSKFSTAKLKSMSSMFNGCSSLESLDLSNFNTANVTDMNYMFYNCSSLKSLTLSSKFSTDDVTTMSYMFYKCSSLESLDLSSFNTANVTNMMQIFYYCSNLTSLTLSSNFNTANVTSLASMFYGCSSLESLDLSSFNTANVTSMNSMFYNCSSLKSLDLSSFNTDKVGSTNMNSMFYGCSGLKSLDLSSFNTDNMTSLASMFKNCSSLESLDLSSFNTAKVSNMSYMFQNCSSLKSLTLSSNFNTANVTNMSYMFNGCSGFTSLDLSSFNTAKVSNMSYMFQNCSSLESLDLSNFDTANVTSYYGMQYMFSGCSSLKSLNLSSFNTANVTYYGMRYMFSGCTSLKSLDLSSFNTAKAMNMSSMFDQCSQLTTIYVSDSFTTDAVTSSTDMFKDCSSLVGAIEYNSEIIDKTGANYVTGYFTYAIKTAEDLKSFAECVNTAGNETGAAALLADITLTAEDSFTPIGSNGYKGNFDGLGHSISGLNFSESTYNCLFNNNAGTIKNLGVVNATIANGSTGCICSSNTGTISNCFFMGTTESTTTPNGAVCQTNNGTITNCYNIAGNDDGNGDKTEEQFKSGEVCYLLAQGTDGYVWGQLLETNTYPVSSEYKVIKAFKGAKDINDNDTYWSTFSNLTNDVTLSVPEDRTLAVYNATVSSGKMTLRKRSDNQVAMGDGVLLKSDNVYVNFKANETDGLTKEDYANNNLVATPAEAQTITADEGYTLYRLTYNNVTDKTDLGFYLGGADGVNDGSRLKATPGKAYLKVSNSASGSAPLRGFVIGEDDNTTGIDEITINGIDVNIGIDNEGVYDLQGRKVIKPAKGIYIKNGKKIIIK